MLSKSIIVKSINNLSDARYCAGMGVEYLAVNMDEDSENHLSIELFNEVKNWLVGVKWIGETKSEDIEEVKELLTDYGIEKILTKHFSIAEQLKYFDFEAFVEIEDLNLLNNEFNFILSEIDSSSLSQLTIEKNHSIYLEGNFDELDLTTIKNNDNIKGIVIEGGEEERPGFKNMDELIETIEFFEIEY